ncbi:MAG: hypothetical protein U1F83_04465 [Verrucomicrobiota bacterium]
MPIDSFSLRATTVGSVGGLLDRQLHFAGIQMQLWGEHHGGAAPRGGWQPGWAALERPSRLRADEFPKLTAPQAHALKVDAVAFGAGRKKANRCP